MRRIAVVAVLVLAAVGAGAQVTAVPPGADGEVVRAWDDLAQRAVRLTSASDAQAARTYAMVHVAVYDAVNGLAGGGPERRAPALVAPPVPPPHGDAVVAAAGAAHDVLVALYPAHAALFDTRLQDDLAGANRGQAGPGRRWGAEVAAAVLAARQADGSVPNETQAGGSGPGVFTASWSGVQFRNLTPFAIADPAAYVSPGPPALTSLDYAAAFAEVKLLGSAAIPDPPKLATFQYWSLGGGTSQPPGAWLQVAGTVSTVRALSLADTARLFALEAMAMADTVAPTYTTKFASHFWRPTTAIRQAATDGNPDTVADPAWAARAGSVGSSPEHWSGHSSFSAAGATVLAGFLCDDGVAFSLVTDSAPGGAARSYARFSEAAAEAGRSRVLGGFHFEFSNQAGLSAGRAVADEVLATALLATHGPTHHGACPL